MPATRNNESSSPMSPRSRKTHPYTPGKSPRKQNTACAACRRRRVRCDRRDGNVDVCTECAQRGFACVDEASREGKIYRRGRKIQELEVLYGQYPPGQRPNAEEVRHRLAAGGSRTVSSASTSSRYPAIKELKMDFFSSEFFKWFQMQVPVLDPTEFIDRYDKFIKRGTPLGTCGELIAQTLVAWATSFGFDETGAYADFVDDGVKAEDDEPLATVEKRKTATNAIVRQILDAVDKHTLARKTSIDGVRVLMLLLPLTDDLLPPVDRAYLYRCALLQTYELAGLDGSSEQSGVPGEPVSELARARIVWHAIVNEGITSALQGTKLVFDQDDAVAFKTITPDAYDIVLKGCALTSHLNSSFTFVPCRLAAVCRLVSETLTSPKAERLAESGKDELTQEHLDVIWSSLEESWNEFESLRGAGESLETLEDELQECFVGGWQIFIYTIHNIVREKIWTRISRLKESIDPRRAMTTTWTSTLSGVVSYTDITAKNRLRDLMTLHDMAEARCNALVHRVLEVVRRNSDSSFFELDVGLVEPGIIYVADHLARASDNLEDFNYCIDALQKMRWAFSRGESQVQRLQAEWDSRRVATTSTNHIVQQQVMPTNLLPAFNEGSVGPEFLLDGYNFASGSSFGGLPQVTMYPTSNVQSQPGNGQWQSSLLHLSPSNISLDGISNGTRRSGAALSIGEMSSSPISPTRSLFQGSTRSVSPIDVEQQRDIHHPYLRPVHSYEDLHPSTPALPALALDSSTFHSPMTDIIGTPVNYGRPIINLGRMDSPPHAQISAALGPLGPRGSSFLDGVHGLMDHYAPEPQGPRSGNSSASSSSIHLLTSPEAPLPPCEQSYDLLHYLNEHHLLSYGTSQASPTFSL